MQIAGHLDFPWPLARVFMIVPRQARDAVYDYVAANRYKWFGLTEKCQVRAPSLEISSPKLRLPAHSCDPYAYRAASSVSFLRASDMKMVMQVPSTDILDRCIDSTELQAASLQADATTKEQ